MDDKINKGIVDVLTRSFDPILSNFDDEKDLSKLRGAVEATKGDFIRAIDYMLITDETKRSEWNYLAKKAGKSGVHYGIMARSLKDAGVIDDAAYKRAAGVFDSTTTPGGGEFLQTTVADFVAETIEELGLVANTVVRMDLSNDGNFKIPRFDGSIKSDFVADAANFTDLGATVEGGITSITLDPQKVGSYMAVYQSYLHKVSVSRLQWLLGKLAEAQARAYDDAILNADGTGNNPTGMNQNATAVTLGGDAFETLTYAVATISDARKGRATNIMGYMNTAALQAFIRLNRTLPNERKEVIEVKQGTYATVAGIPFVITDVIGNVGAAGSKTTTVTVGYRDMYYWGDAKRPVIETSNHVGFLSGTEHLKISGMANGKPVFDDAFAKFDIANVA